MDFDVELVWRSFLLTQSVSGFYLGPVITDRQLLPSNIQDAFPPVYLTGSNLKPKVYYKENSNLDHSNKNFVFLMNIAAAILFATLTIV